MSSEEHHSSASSSSFSNQSPIEQHEPLVSQFLEIVGESINVEHATDILRSCGWNLEVKI